jgi:rubrerythrin
MESIAIDALRAAERVPPTAQKHSLVCSACGYGVARATPPDHCPMCRREVEWVHRPWRPFSARAMS